MAQTHTETDEYFFHTTLSTNAIFTRNRYSQAELGHWFSCYQIRIRVMLDIHRRFFSPLIHLEIIATFFYTIEKVPKIHNL